eukprot:TRINITY_DN6389_c0_g3_i1.p1 TRINITY_DN6389_c0_g3~~TRINITY_DN6389_c0_g3_i1.p1  ORF type:complete len:653 (-),score=82.83 TRINITY_DN6389_c0_g3_i1:455-2413(-)
MRTDAESIAAFALVAVIVLLYTVAVSCSLKRKLQVRWTNQCPQSLKKGVETLFKSTINFRPAQKSDSEKKMEAAAKKVHDDKLKNFQKRTVLLAAPVLAVSLLYHASEMAFRSESRFEDASLADYHGMQVALLILFATYCLVSDEGPSGYASILWHALGVALLLYITLKLARHPRSAYVALMNDRANVITTRLCHSVLARDLHTGIMFNLVYGIGSLTTLFFLEVPSFCGEGFGNKDYTDSTWTAFCMSEVAISFLLCLMVQVLQDRSKTEARAFVEAQSSQTDYRAAFKLLASFCDVVLEIDNNLMITENAPKLASMLLHSLGKSLKGSKITEFIASDTDKEVFQTLLRSTESAGEAALSHPMQLRMRDSTSTLLEVEVFHTLVQDLDSEKGRFLIGIRELSEAEQSHVHQFGSAEAVADAEAAVEKIVKAGHHVLEEPPDSQPNNYCCSLSMKEQHNGSISQSNQSLRSHGKVPSLMDTKINNRETWCLINVLSMVIEAASPRFADKLDELDEQNAGTVFYDNDRRFATFCQDLMNNVYYNGDLSPHGCIDHLKLKFGGKLVKGQVSCLVPVAADHDQLPILMRFRLKGCRSDRGSESSEAGSSAGTPSIIGRAAQGLVSDLGSGPDGDKFCISEVNGFSKKTAATLKSL